ncbi:hypothetical protein Gotur_003232, partial [Gossypium turneri]
NVTGRNSKPVTIAPNASNGGLLLRWGSFGPRELARFKELLEKPIRLKSVKADLGKFGRTDHLRSHGLRDERSSPVISGIRAVGLNQVISELLVRRHHWDVERRVRTSIKDVNEALDGVEGRIDNWKKQSRDYVKMSLDSTMDKVNELFNSHKDKLSERNDALEATMLGLKEETMATVMALSTRIEELEGELALCRAAIGKEVYSTALSNEDVPKPKEFVGTRSVCDVDNFLWRMENYFHVKGIVDDVLPEAMMVVESVVRLGLGKDKLGSSKSEERGICEVDHKEDVVDGNGNGNNSGNEKPRVVKKKPKRKRDKLKCFLCDGPHMLKKCPKKSALTEKPVSKALILGSSAKSVEAKEAKSEKKPVECFLCHGPHRLWKFSRKSVIEGNDGAVKEPKELGSSKGKAEAKRAKRSKKKRGFPPKKEVSFSLDLEEKVAIKTVKLGPMRLKLS